MSWGWNLEVKSGGQNLEVESVGQNLEVESGGQNLEVESGGQNLEVVPVDRTPVWRRWIAMDVGLELRSKWSDKLERVGSHLKNGKLKWKTQLLCESKLQK